MNGFTDIHTHILPGVDDGADSMQEACRLVRMAWENGTKVLFLTPHYRGDYGNYSPDRLQEVFSQLQELVAREMPDMRLLLGTEIRFDSDVPEKLQQGEILSMNGSRFVLLEFSQQTLRSQIILGVSELLRYGYTPVIAHTERYDAFRIYPNLADEVRKLGAYIQINADSVMGACGFSVKRFVHRLLKGRRVDFVATDAHDSKNRPPLLRKCFLRVSRRYGQDYAAQVFGENAWELIENEWE